MLKPIAISLSLALFASMPAQACEGMGAGHACKHHHSKVSAKAGAKAGAKTGAEAAGARFGILEAAAVRDLLVREPHVQFIDVRETDEFAAGRPQGTRNLPLSKIDEWAPKLDKSTKYVLTCRSGRRSGIAAGKLAELGIAEVHNMAGGLQAWESAGLPIEK